MQRKRAGSLARMSENFTISNPPKISYSQWYTEFFRGAEPDSHGKMYRPPGIFRMIHVIGMMSA